MKQSTQLQYCILIFFLITFSALGQRSDFILGKLFDSETNEPVVFANIRIKDRAVGIITNVDGSFRIPLKYKEYGDIIEISSMGYETKELPINDLNLEGLNILTLKPAAISLEEAVVKAKGKKRLSARQIVQKAIAAIPDNYPMTSFSTIGYYRDYQRNEQQYLNLNEAILQVFDQGFDQFDDATSKTRVFYFKMNDAFEQDSLAKMSYDYESFSKIAESALLDVSGGNEFRILRIHDAIRNYNVFSHDFIGTLKTDLINNHSFIRSNDTRIDDEDLYRIALRANYPNFRANGMLYISKWDFAIYKLEYTMYDDNQRNATGEKNKHGHRQKAIFDMTTDYRRINDKMYLNYISLNNNFILNIPPVFTTIDKLVNLFRRCFTVGFSDIPEDTSAVDPRHYKVLFKNRPVKIKTITRSKNRVNLFPDLENEDVIEMFNILYKVNQDEENVMDYVDIRVSNVKDVNGNLVDKTTQRAYQQFREFFAQRIKPDSRAPFDGSFMDPRKPIFENRTGLKPPDYDDYWMNTPLLETMN